MRVGHPIPQTCLKACEFGKSALILRKPRHGIWRFSESEGTIFAQFLLGLPDFSVVDILEFDIKFCL